ncbi:hypothetical protein BOTBODRAFT_109706, partial [Botryobasidium botryosum FD-172 SS1]
RFRILVIGRANSGKTTVLQAVCGTDRKPEVYDEDGDRLCAAPSPPSSVRGEHYIEYQLIFPGKNGFVFHDSRGFEAGAVDERDIAQRFIDERATRVSLHERIHAIWYCFSADTNRFHTELDFFEKINTGDGCYCNPSIAIFTKFDGLDAEVYMELCDEGVPSDKAFADAHSCADEKFDQTCLHLVRSQKYLPSGEVHLRSKSYLCDAMSKLVEKAVNSLNSKVLLQILVSVQQNTVEIS